MFMVRLVTAMIAGVVLLGAGRDPSHPVQLAAAELMKINLVARVPNQSLEELVDLAEEIGTQIWRVADFQSDPDVRTALLSLVAEICQQPAKYVECRDC